MKQLRLLFFLLFASCAAFSQVQDVNGFGFSYNMLETKKVFNLPSRCDTNLEAKYRAVLKPGSFFWDSCANHRWIFYGNSWHVDSTGGGSGGSTDTTSLSNRINTKVDSITQSHDTTYYWISGAKHFAAKGNVSKQRIIDSLGYAPLRPTDTINLSHRTDTLSATMIAAIGAKVGNFLGVAFLGIGPHSSAPTSGQVLYYDTDSSSFCYRNGASYTNLFPAFNISVISQNSAYPDSNYIKAVGGNLAISPLWDSIGNCIKHLIYPDGRLVWYNSCATILNAGASKSIAAGTLGSRPAASNCQCYYFSTTDSTWSYDNGSWIPVKGGGGASYFTKTGNYLYPNNTTDSVGVGTATPTANFSIVGKVDQTQSDTTNTAGTRTANSLIVRLNGNPGTSSVNYAWNLQFASLGSTSHGKFNAVNINYDNAPGFLGTLNTANGIEFNPGNIGQVGTFTGLQLNDGNGTTGYNGIFSAMSAGTGKLFINHNGTAPSKFMGPIGINTGSPDASAWLDIPGTSKGVLIPRGTTAQRDAIASPATGLLFFNLDSAGSGRALQYYTGSAWIAQGGVTGGGGGTPAGSDGQVQINNTGSFGVVANLKVNKATGTLNSDSARTHLNYTDSSQYTNLGGLLYATTMSTFDNSIGVGYPYTDTTIRWSYQLASKVLHVQEKNYSVSSTGVATAIATMNKNVNPGHSTFTNFGGEFNDVRQNGLPRVTSQKVLNAMKAAIANQFAKKVVQAGTTGLGVTRTGSWTINWDATIQTGKSTNAAYTTTNNDTLTYAFTDSTVFAVVMGASGLNGYTGSDFSMYIDGVLSGSYTTKLQSDGKVDVSSYSNDNIPMAFFVTGLTNAAHTLKLVKNGTGLFIVDYVGNLVDKSKAYPIMLIQATHMNSTGYATAPANSTLVLQDTLNNRIDSLKAQTLLGYPILVSHVNTYFNTATDLYTDGIHLDTLGYYHHFQADSLAFVSYIKTPIAPGMFYYTRNGVHVRRNDNTDARVVTAEDSTAIMNQTVYPQTGGFNVLNHSYVGDKITANLVDIGGTIASEKNARMTMGWNQFGNLVSFYDPTGSANQKLIDIYKPYGSASLQFRAVLDNEVSANTFLQFNYGSGNAILNAQYNTTIRANTTSGNGLDIIPYAGEIGLNASSFVISGSYQHMAANGSASTGLQYYLKNTSSASGAYSNGYFESNGTTGGSAALLTFRNTVWGRDFYAGLDPSDSSFKVATGNNVQFATGSTPLFKIDRNGKHFILQTPTTGSSTDSVLVRVTATGEERMVAQSSLGALIPTFQQTITNERATHDGGLSLLTKTDTISGRNLYTLKLDSLTNFLVNASAISFNSTASGLSSLVINGPSIALFGGLLQQNITISSGITLTQANTASHFIDLTTPSSNQTITLPTAGSNLGAWYKISNLSTSTSFAWSFGGVALLDGSGNTVTAIPNGYTYEIFCAQNGSNWRIKNISYVGAARTGIPAAGSYSSTGTATTTFTVTTGVTQPNSTYKVGVTPTDALAAGLFYVTNKTTTTFDVVYLSGLTGVVSFDWTVTP